MFCNTNIQLASVTSFLTLFKFKVRWWRGALSSRISHIDPFTHPKGVKHLGANLVHTSPCNCIPVFNSSVSIKHLFSQFLIKSELIITVLAIWTQPFLVKNHSSLVSHEVKSWRTLSDWNENVYSFNKLNWYRGITPRTWYSWYSFVDRWDKKHTRGLPSVHMRNGPLKLLWREDRSTLYCLFSVRPKIKTVYEHLWKIDMLLM